MEREIRTIDSAMWQQQEELKWTSAAQPDATQNCQFGIHWYDYEPVTSMTDYKGLGRYQSKSKGASGAPPEVAGRKTNSTERGTLRR